MNWELSAVFIGSAIRFATPLLLGATGELVSQRAGVLNMSLEGMMLTGAFAGAVGSWASASPLIGLALGILAVLPVALLQAFLSITLRANQIVTGIGINILALGATTLAYREIFGSRSSAAIPGLAKNDYELFIACLNKEAQQLGNDTASKRFMAVCSAAALSVINQKIFNP